MIKRLLFVVLLALIGSAPAYAGSNLPLVIQQGQTRQLPPGTTLTLQAPGTDGSIILPPGTPSGTPTNGACWSTTGGLFCRINGVTVGPYFATSQMGTGVSTALGVNVDTAGSVVVNGGALGTPSSGTLTNVTGLPATGITGTLVTGQLPNVTNANLSTLSSQFGGL